MRRARLCTVSRRGDRRRGDRGRVQAARTDRSRTRDRRHLEHPRVAIDHTYWEKLGYKGIAAGIAPECYATPIYADVNMGARYSSDGAVQYAISQHPSKIVFDQSNVPGTGYLAAGPNAIAKASKVPISDQTENVPIRDANSVALEVVNTAGSNGAVVLNFTPPEALVILQAAQNLGLEDRVKLWGCSTPCDTDFLATTLGPKWNHKFFVNAEMTPPDPTNSPTMNVYKAILKQYGSSVSGGIGSFSQMGFVIAEIATHALESVKAACTVQSVNKAFEGVKGSIPECCASRGRTERMHSISPTTSTTRLRRRTGRW